MLEKKGAKKLSDVNEVLGGIDYTKLKTKHITLIAQNLAGIKNLYKIVSIVLLKQQHLINSKVY